MLGKARKWHAEPLRQSRRLLRSSDPGDAQAFRDVYGQGVDRECVSRSADQSDDHSTLDLLDSHAAAVRSDALCSDDNDIVTRSPAQPPPNQ
jgi:hypothetical protein